MDELLFERVEQLKAIDDRLERLLSIKPDIMHKSIRDLRNELAVMIETAKAEHAAF